jgi:hypothetical protein
MPIYDESGSDAFDLWETYPTNDWEFIDPIRRHNEEDSISFFEEFKLLDIIIHITDNDVISFDEKSSDYAVRTQVESFEILESFQIIPDPIRGEDIIEFFEFFDTEFLVPTNGEDSFTLSEASTVQKVLSPLTQNVTDIFFFDEMFTVQKLKTGQDTIALHEHYCLCLEVAKGGTESIAFTEAYARWFPDPNDPRNNDTTVGDGSGIGFRATYRKRGGDSISFAEQGNRVDQFGNIIIDPSCCNPFIFYDPAGTYDNNVDSPMTAATVTVIGSLSGNLLPIAVDMMSSVNAPWKTGSGTWNIMTNEIIINIDPDWGGGVAGGTWIKEDRALHWGSGWSLINQR